MLIVYLKFAPPPKKKNFNVLKTNLKILKVKNFYKYQSYKFISTKIIKYCGGGGIGLDNNGNNNTANTNYIINIFLLKII